MISPVAIQMIEIALTPIIRSGKRVDNINLMVCPTSNISQLLNIETRFGLVKIVPGDCVPKGYSYLIEKPLSIGGKGFAWVSKK
ncbi:hypothetical protein [Paenibacillus macquariensis]|uniref:Uncharacterized protein n=1 Tax=Paenibacillus macquariensis TaxID=948756 RepID=A0ABY1KHW0_9BACL|nr:hypothetical protein [Paenibacillus macquariensis]MEC0092487.1 hypothetical protein [Paenibacillus macquariensis]OAB35446.1 hypothetical protein PMSM_09320 [Paenibacillus macquariensis subsp. macquariensis]SIR74532.1 hypothetical protein SAMN05421578_1615 [Paenibacillus macquariensis]